MSFTWACELQIFLDDYPHLLNPVSQVQWTMCVGRELFADTKEYSQHEEVGAHELDTAVLVDPISGLLAAVAEEQPERQAAQHDQQRAAHTVPQEVPITLPTST